MVKQIDCPHVSRRPQDVLPIGCYLRRTRGEIGYLVRVARIVKRGDLGIGSHDGISVALDTDERCHFFGFLDPYS